MNGYIVPPYFDLLREMIRRAEFHADKNYAGGTDVYNTNHLYEIEALTNVIGEMECIRGECERRIRYLQNNVAQDI